MDYMITGDETQTLQFVIQPNNKLTIDISCLCWFDNELIISSRGLFLSRLFSSTSTSNISLGDVVNDTVNPLVVALNQIENNRILVINIEKPTFIMKESFVCAQSSLNILPKVLPFEANFQTILTIPHLFNKAHHCTLNFDIRNSNPSATTTTPNNTNIHKNNKNNKLFLQNGNIILIKELKANQFFTVKFHCLVGFEETCTITVVNPFKNIFMLWGEKDTFIKMQGVYIVYMYGVCMRIYVIVIVIIPMVAIYSIFYFSFHFFSYFIYFIFHSLSFFFISKYFPLGPGVVYFCAHNFSRKTTTMK